jgi:hypothetical protein
MLWTGLWPPKMSGASKPVSASTEAARLEALVRVLTRKDDRGQLVYSKRERRDFCVLIWFAFPKNEGQVPPALKAAIEEFARETGIAAKDGMDANAAKLQAYFKRTPLPPTLREEAKRALATVAANRKTSDIFELG